MKTTLLSSVNKLCCLLLILILASCGLDEESPTPPPLSPSADLIKLESWYKNQKPFLQSTGKNPFWNANARTLEKNELREFTISWEHPKEITLKSGRVVYEFPVNRAVHVIPNFSSLPETDLFPIAESVIFVPNSEGYSLYLLKYFSESNPGFELGLGMVDEAFSGFASLHDIYDNPLRIYEYSAGELAGKGYLTSSSEDPGKDRKVSSMRIQTCIDIEVEWDEATMTYDPELKMNVLTVIGHTSYSTICFDGIGGGGAGEGSGPEGGGSSGDGWTGGPENEIDLGEGTSPITYYDRIDPCKHANALGHDLNFRSTMQSLQNTLHENYETYYLMRRVGDYYSYGFGTGSPGTLEIKLSISEPISGIIHSHYEAPGSLPIFSMADVQAFYKLASQDLLQGSIKEAVFGVVTSHETAYLLKVDDPTAFLEFGAEKLKDNSSLDNLDAWFIIWENNYINQGKSFIEANELAFLEVLKNAGIILLKSNGTFTNYSKISNNNGNLKSSGC